MAENEGQEETKSANNIQNLVFVPQGCSYFLDTTDSKENDPQQQRQYIGLITQGCGPCACIIVRNQDNTKMVLAHVDSSNDIINEEFGLPKWVRQCKGDIDNNNRDNNNGNNNDDVIVEVHIGCGQVGIKKEDGTGRQEQAILGFERTIQQLRNRLNFTYDGRDRSPGSQGGMILRNGYSIVIDKTKSIRRKLNPNYRRNVGQISERWINEETTVNCYKILRNPKRKENRIILNEQISFDENMTDQLVPTQQRINAGTIQTEISKQIKQTCLKQFQKYINQQLFDERIQKGEDIVGAITENITGLIRFDEIKEELDNQGYDFKNSPFKFNIHINEYNLLKNLNSKNCLNNLGLLQLERYQQHDCIDRTL